MRRNKLVITLLVVVVAFGSVVALMRKQAAQTWRLPDGSELSLAKVTYGKTHEMRSGNGWRDYLYPVLPLKWRAKLGCQVATLTPADPDSVVVWFWLKNQPPPGLLPSGFPSRALEQYHLMIVDENGFESEPVGGSGDYISTPGQELNCRELPPMRSMQNKEIKIRIYTAESENETRRQLVGEFKIPNPKAK